MEKSGEPPLTNPQRAGTLGGSHPTWEVWAWMHLNTCPLNVTSAPTAKKVLGCHGGMLWAETATAKKQRESTRNIVTHVRVIKSPV
jgi:hypothetical protein